MNTRRTTNARTEYAVLNRALKALRDAITEGDLSGFESFADLYHAICATEARMFEITASVRR